MKTFSKIITKHYGIVLVIAVILLIASFIGMTATKINYDILSYLPDNLNSVKGEHILDKDFKTAGSALLLVDMKDLNQVKQLKDEIAAVDGVENVLWIDNMTDTTIPLSYISDSMKDSFIKGDSTLLKIQFEKPASSDTTFKAVDSIKKIMNGKAKLGGMGALLSELRKLVDNEKVLYILLAVILIFIIISIALDSFAISLIFLGSIGLAIAYNMGTNFLRGDISYITSSIAAVLQMGVTMDFSIFLYHRYEQERNKTPDKYEAMAQAMSSTAVAIIASSLATASGFLALIPMRIGIGADIGIVLAKGVIIGVIVALTVLPAMLLMMDGLIQKTRHRAILPTFNKTASFVTKRYIPIFLIFVILFVPAYYGKTHAKILYNIMDAMPSSMNSMKSTNEIKDKFSISEVTYLITEKGESRDKEETLNNELKAIPNVKDSQCIESLADSAVPDTFLPDNLKTQFEKGNYRYIMINLTSKAGEDTTNKTIAAIDDKAKSLYGSKYYLCGEAVLTKDLINTTDKDIKVVDILSIAAVFVILLLAFKSLSLPVILVAVIELAIFFNLGIPYFSGTQVPFIASLTVGAIQLGSSVNYSILMTTRYREELQLHDKFEAMRKAIVGTGPSIITSAITLAAVTIGVGVISKINMIGQFSTMIGRGTLISFVFILFALPTVLLISDTVIKYTTIGWKNTKSFIGLDNKLSESEEM